MNKQLAEAQARIEAVTARLEQELGLSSWWRIKHVFSETQDGSTNGEGVDTTLLVHRTTACTVTQWHYRQAEITWYLPSVAIVDDDWLEWVAIHEYVHVLNAPLADFLFDYLKDDETTTEQLRILGHHSRLAEFVTETLARVIQLARGKDIPA